jgi:nickel-dependent lactate racemase
MVYKALTETLDSRTAQLDFMIALGTHPPMTDKQLSRHFGQTVQDGRIGAHCIHNHAWDDPDALAAIGLITADEMYALSRGKMKEDLVVRINRRIFDYDHLLICGPVFPHEVVGFSGGNKYFFPGISGPEVIDISHWLGALLTNYAVIGSGYTPVRAVIDRAAEMIPKPKSCFAFVLDEAGTYGVFSGTPEIAWEGASALSAERHIITTGRTYERVLSVMPEMYDDLWVGGKGMYKVEPIVADGGEVIIYAPHIKEISYTHGEVLREIGYHVSDYFVKQWDRFKGYPWSELAHSTHVRGLGSYDPETGVETPRIHVTLATGIPEETCQAINLGYRDPAGIDPADWTGREEEGILVIPNAGEHLYRVQ